MVFLHLLMGSLALSNVVALPSTLSKRCTNSASDRSCWGNYDINTDFYNTVPTTGDTVEYYFNVQNVTLSPDGYERNMLVVNGTFPGPTIEANWGDTVVVHVTNNLQNNGTAIHFHGIRQNQTNPNDGVPAVTQCPIAPGETFTYTWRATQYGSSWWHSHFSLQAADGIAGPIVIHGPASGNYDEDLGPLFLSDHSHETAFALYTSAETNGPPTMDNGLINGTNTYNCTGSTDSACSGTGTRFQTTFTPGTKYLLRLVNTAIDTHFKFSIDNHTLTVIANDFVPITPYTADYISIGIAQRYDVIVEANAGVSDYWMRAIPQLTCSDNDNTDNILGIVRYDSTSTSDPSTTAYTMEDTCDDEDATNLVPVVSKTVSTPSIQDDLSVTIGRVDNLFKWYINSTTMWLDWANPTLLQVYNNATSASWDDQSGVIELSEASEWAYFIIETTNAVPHPIHLHGHDFFVLAAGTGTYASASPTLNTANPPRRDVAMLPGSGYLVIAFETDNPGAWLMHCHIGWHTSEGLSLQFVERQSEIIALIDNFDTWNSTCASWDAYTASSVVIQDDSGV